jgi:hypothetical protein
MDHNLQLYWNAIRPFILSKRNIDSEHNFRVPPPVAWVYKPMALYGHYAAYMYIDMAHIYTVNASSGYFVFKQLKIEGFIASRWFPQWPAAFKEMAEWIKEVSSS